MRDRTIFSAYRRVVHWAHAFLFYGILAAFAAFSVFVPRKRLVFFACWRAPRIFAADWLTINRVAVEALTLGGRFDARASRTAHVAVRYAIGTAHRSVFLGASAILDFAVGAYNFVT
jgi:hypothetical protein